MRQPRLARAGNAPAPQVLLRNMAILGVLALAAVLATAGALRAAGTISDGLRARAPFHGTLRIPTSFGALVVDKVEVLGGLTTRDLQGVTHSIQNLVLSDEAQIQVSVQLLNRSAYPVAYSPAQFRLLGGADGAYVAPTSGTLQTGVLPPHGGINAELSFIVPRDGRALWVEYQDPARARPIRIAIEPVYPIPAIAGEPEDTEHSHDNP